MNKNANNEHTYITCNIVDTFFIVFFDNTKQIVNNSTINNQVI